MPHKLPDLPYGHGDLEPHIDGRTMTIHHGKHHQAYVNNLNAALEGHPDLQDKSVLDLIIELNSIPEDIRTAVRNNGGGHLNHTMFWTLMSPKGGGSPGSILGGKIDEAFGSFDEFKAQFKKAGMTQFGSGWAWLVVNGDGNLEVTKTPNQDNPLSQGLVPILGVDVWEHAYYLNYQNRRADYIDAWWNVVDWEQVGVYYGLTKVAGGIADLTSWAKTQLAKLEEALSKITG
jgi:Fe-Mn family superoxide dismutase